VAETFETRVRYGKERLVTVLRYALLLVMGGFVLNVLLAVYLPVFDLIDQLHK
jgi:type II secretory pathway component PulF